MNRRGFLGSCLALAAAPAIVRADSLMRIVPRDAGVIVMSLDYPGTQTFVVTGVSPSITCDQIAAMALRVAHRERKFIGAPAKYQELKVGDEFSIDPALAFGSPSPKQGDTIRIRLPRRYEPRGAW